MSFIWRSSSSLPAKAAAAAATVVTATSVSGMRYHHCIPKSTAMLMLRAHTTSCSRRRTHRLVGDNASIITTLRTSRIRFPICHGVSSFSTDGTVSRASQTVAHGKNEIQDATTPLTKVPSRKSGNSSLQFQRQQQKEMVRQHKRQQQRNQNERAGTGTRSSKMPTQPSSNQHPAQRLQAIAQTLDSQQREGGGGGGSDRHHRLDSAQAGIRLMLNELHQLRSDIDQHVEGNMTVRPVWHTHPTHTPMFRTLGQSNNNNNTYVDAKQQEYYVRAVDISQTLQSCIERKLIQPSNKHRHEFAAITERLLHIFCSIGGTTGSAAKTLKSFSTDEGDATEQTSVEPNQQHYRHILRLIQAHGLELSHAQCYSAIQLAARDGHWTEAAEWYRNHTDPDVAGYLPVVNIATSNTSVPLPNKRHLFTITGLYCMARAALETGMLPVESVLEGVNNLTLVSPSDSETYILAAGVALGHAGEWEALCNYLKSSYKSSQLGQPLVAATMQACVLCHRYDEALALFDELVDGELAAASEWQWDGGKDHRLHPACRDLAIRALGGAYATAHDEAERFNLQQRALSLYREAQADECKVSVEALCAVITCCSDNEWEMIAHMFLDVLDKNPTSWLVFGDECQISSEQSQQDQLSLPDIVPHLGFLVDNVMQAFNVSQKYGAALLCFRLFDTSLVSLVATPYQRLVGGSSGSARDDAPPLHSPIVQAMVPVICAVRNRPELLATTMVALCGVKLYDEAINLYEAIATISPSAVPGRHPYDVYSYAESLRSSVESSVYQPWGPILRHIHRLTAALAAISDNAHGNNTVPPSEADWHMLSSALAVTVRECSAASASETGILLGKWVERRPIEQTTDAAALFYEVEDQYLATLPLPLTDSLLSSAIEAFAQNGRGLRAENLVQAQLGTEQNPSEWPLSYHEAVKLLFAKGQSEDGLALFRTVVANGGTPALYCTAARNLISAGNWRPVLDLYRQSLKSGCTSEELGILTMEAIAASGRIGQKDSQFPLLRSVISETAKSLGTMPAVWIESNYWKLKRVLGFSVARLIMGWDDYKRCRLDELDLAIETLEKRSSSGLTAKNAVLFSIVQAAGNYEQYQVPFNATGLPKVPRDKDAWIAILEMAIHEAKETRLMAEPNFLAEVAIAFHKLGCHAACVEVVHDALSRGLRLNKAALESAMQAASQCDETYPAVKNIQMMLIEG